MGDKRKSEVLRHGLRAARGAVRLLTERQRTGFSLEYAALHWCDRASSGGVCSKAIGQWTGLAVRSWSLGGAGVERSRC
jgi:hypothetical protein